MSANLLLVDYIYLLLLMIMIIPKPYTDASRIVFSWVRISDLLMYGLTLRY